MGKLVQIGAERDVKVAPELSALLVRIGGTNPYGEPMYRLVWGWTRKEWMGGRWQSGYVGFKYEPKYEPKDRFHLEFWNPPSSYGTREQWRRDTAVTVNGVAYESLADYPSRGEWEWIWVCESPDGRYLSPTHDLLLHVVQAHKRGLETTPGERSAYRSQNEARGRESFQKRRAELLREAGHKFMSAAMKGRTVRELKEEMAAVAPANHPRVSDRALRRLANANG